MPTYQYVPSRHGVHLPHDSCLKNSDHFLTARTTQSSSSKIWTAEVPFIEPALTTVSKSSGRSRCSVVSSGQDAPPGVQNLSSLPRLIPPASSSSSRSVVPMGASYCPGFFTRPDSEKIDVPGEPSGPSALYQSAPPNTMYGTLASVPTLLTTVGAS